MGCGPPRVSAPPEAPPIDPLAFSGQRALDAAGSFLAVGPRVAGTPGARAAADYLAARLRALDVEAALDSFEDDAPEGKVLFHNVVGRIPGRTPRLIVIGCHYDTKSGISPDFQGANDSGSGVGVLLELASVLKASGPLDATVLLAFLDGEECARQYGPRDGLHGSRRLARQLVGDGRARQVIAVVIADMVGDRDLGVMIPRNGSPGLVAQAFAAAQDEGARLAFSLGHPVLDDHAPFLDAGMPAVDLIDFAYGSTPGANDYWHTPADTLDKLGARSLEIVGRVILRMLNGLTSEGGVPPLRAGAASGSSAVRHGL
jgi:glutaminyl-peptide cyclotransferase